MLFRLISIIVLILIFIFAYRFYQQHGTNVNATNLKSTYHNTIDWVKHGAGTTAPDKASKAK